MKNALERKGTSSDAESIVSDDTDRVDSVVGKVKSGAPLVEPTIWYIVIEEGETSCRCL